MLLGLQGSPQSQLFGLFSEMFGLFFSNVFGLFSDVFGLFFCCPVLAPWEACLEPFGMLLGI